MSKSILWLPQACDTLVLHTDAYQGIGAVLSAVRDGVVRPLGFFSSSLKPAEGNYSATEVECLAVVRAVDHFTIHLVGQRFTVITDHQALTSLLTSNRLNGRLMRWSLML